MVHPPHDCHSLPNIPAPSMLPTSVLLASVLPIVHCLVPLLHRVPTSSCHLLRFHHVPRPVLLTPVSMNLLLNHNTLPPQPCHQLYVVHLSFC